MTCNHGLFCIHRLARIRGKLYLNYNPKHQVRVDGKMSEQDTDKVGNKLANVVIIFVVLIGFSGVMAACRWWYPIYQFKAPPSWRFFYGA